MLVVSSREFRDKQASYFDRADSGEEVLVRRGRDKSYKIVPAAVDETLMSKKEFFAQIDQALEEAKEGKGIVIRSQKELMDYFDNL